MVTTKQTVSVRMDKDAAHRLEKAAHLMRQSRGAFLEKAGDEVARQILRQWAVVQYRQGATTFSELAQETGLAVEEIMAAMGTDDRQGALDMFLASCQAVAEMQGNPDFLRMAQEAVEVIAGVDHPGQTASSP